MRDDVSRDYVQSSRDFEAIVGPAVLGWLGGGDLINLQRQNSSKAMRALDLDALIDALQINPGVGVRGIAYRIQYMRKQVEPGGLWRIVMTDPWDTITRRKRRPSTGARTEDDKLELLLGYRDEGWFWPGVTIHAYLERPGGPLVHVVAAHTAALQRFHQQYSHLVTEDRAADGGEEFYIYDRQDLVDAGFRVLPQELPPGLKVLRRKERQ